MGAYRFYTVNQLLGWVDVYRGSLASAPIRPADVFKGAVRANAASVILAHNHPSGDPTPSPEDARATETLVEAGKLLDVEVLDHVVIGHGRWESLRARRLGFRS